MRLRKLNRMIDTPRKQLSFDELQIALDSGSLLVENDRTALVHYLRVAMARMKYLESRLWYHCNRGDELRDKLQTLSMVVDIAREWKIADAAWADHLDVLHSGMDCGTCLELVANEASKHEYLLRAIDILDGKL